MSEFGDDTGDLDGGGETPSALHLTYQARLFAQVLLRGEVQTWEGPFEDVLAKFNTVKLGERTSEVIFLTGGGSASEGTDWGEAFVSDIQAPRRRGNVWSLQITVQQLRHAGVWTLSFAEICKPIRTWHQDWEQSNDIPDLPKLAAWELAKEREDFEHYDSYQTVEGEKLTDATLTLAKMIREKGVESYTVHAPVATLTMRYLDTIPGVGGLLDKWLTELPSLPAGWAELGSARGIIESANAGDGTRPAGVWFCQADQETPNADGSKTRTVQFLGVTDVNTDLYGEAASPSDGGFA